VLNLYTFLIFLIYNNIFKINKLSSNLNDLISKISTFLKSNLIFDKLFFKRISEYGHVISIIDGDTVIVDIDGKKYEVRYIGIDTPEIDYENNLIEFYGIEAKEKNEELVLEKYVELEKDISETDKYERPLRHVWIEGKMINEVLIKQGYAQELTIPPDVKYADIFLKAEIYARENNLGLWKNK